MDLEGIVKDVMQLGLDYVKRKQISDQLTELKQSVRAEIMNELDDGNTSETKLKRLAEADPRYKDHIEKMIAMQASSNEARIRYEACKNLFDAKRSELSYKKAEMNLV